MPESVLDSQAANIAAHLDQKGELPLSTEEMAKPIVDPTRKIISHGKYSLRGGRTVELAIFAYTPVGTNGKPLAERFRFTLREGTTVKRLEFRPIKSDDPDLIDTLEELFGEA